MDRCRILVVAAVGLCAALWTYACGDGTTEPPPPPPDPPRPTTVTVSPATVELAALGATVQLSAEVRDQNGQVMTGATVTWASGAAAVATISASGLVTAVADGTATITATSGSASGSATVTVVQEVSAVTVSPATASLAALGDTVRLAAQAFDENGHRVEGAEFGWSSSDVSVARVDASGLVTGVAEGTATVTAAAGDASGASEITVKNPDRAALVALYNATDGPNWVDSENWLTDAPLGEWYGVDTDASGRVVTLRLGGAYRNGEYAGPGLSGAIPPEIGALTRLVTLDLHSNDLSGAIPPELGELANLATLDLQWNDLTGEIPPELGDLANLKVLRFYSNELSGDIPPELGNLTSLTFLGLGLNGLTGRIPPTLGRLASLESLILRINRLTGPIPPELGNLASLDRLWLWENNLSGPIPPELGNLASLTELHLSSNNLSGPIPESFFQLARLEEFYFRGNDGLCAPGTTGFVAWMEGLDASDAYCNEADVAALEQLYNASNGPNWTNADGWLDTPALEEWHGVDADPLGRVTILDLTDNGLSGRLTGQLGVMAHMTTLRIGSNALTGRVPSSLTQLPLHEFHYADTELCAPPLSSFREWLNSIASHRGTGVECARLSEREILEVLYDGTDGPNWTRSDNWLTAAPLGDWHGVRTNASGRVNELRLAANNLTGTIPAELGHLSRLTELVLWNNSLSGSIPPELGELRSLSLLVLGANELTGPIPAEFGNLASLTEMWLLQSDLSGPLPPELGNLAQLQILSLDDNALTGPIPPEFGRLTALEWLVLDYNRLTGPVPREIGGMSSLERLTLTDNAGMSGPLPLELTGLDLEALIAGGTDLCAPGDTGFQTWLATVYHRRITPCGSSDPPMAYLTQAVQSQEFPVPLVAGEKALLRVFPTARQTTSVGIPAIRARFFVNGRETHVENIPGKFAAIPTEVDESRLSKSANAEIPAEVIQPGLEMVIEVDPEGTLDEQLGVASRIPETGRLAVDVRTMPLLDLTLIPMIWTETGDSSIVDLVGAAAADPENHEMLEETRTLLPVGTLDLKAHEPVLSSSNNIFDLRAQAEAIRLMEGSRGHHAGLMTLPVTGGGAGVAYLPGRAFGSIPVGRTIAHELGHNMNLFHAPCGTGGDPSYPYADGSIGAWGYDFGDGGRLVPPSTPDLMSYCNARWISDYSFTNALRYRLFDEGSGAGAAVAASTRSLLLWGGLGADSVPFLEPAFVVEAPAALPDSAGAHRLIGRAASGAELFSLSFTMPETADGDGRSSFAFVLPVRPGWEGNLASITLDGPGGSVTLDGESDSSMAILLNPRTGQVRGILRDLPPPTQAARDAAGRAAGPGLEVLFSRGIPAAGAWRR